MQFLLGAGDTHVGKAPFFFELIGVALRTHMRKDAFLHAHQEHVWKLQPLGCVQGHHHNSIVIVEFVGVGHERHLLKKLIDAGELAS